MLKQVFWRYERQEALLLCDHLTTLDAHHRWTKFVEHTEVPAEVDSMIQAILGYDELSNQVQRFLKKYLIWGFII